MLKANKKNQHLTSRQAEILRFVHTYIQRHSFSPSIREICEAVSLSSSSTVHSHLISLENKGYLRRDPSKPRSIEVINWPGMLGELPSADGKALENPLNDPQATQMEISRLLRVDDTNSFLYKISTDRYKDEAIMPGDFLVVVPTDKAQEGDMVLAHDAQGGTDEICTYKQNRANTSVKGRITGIIRKISHRG